MVLSHVGFPISSLEESRRFYETVLAPLGYKELKHYERASGYGIDGQEPDFFIEHHPGDVCKLVHVAFLVESRKLVQQFYETALKSGGTDNGAPGLRERYGTGYFSAYVRDLDGNNIEAITYASE